MTIFDLGLALELVGHNECLTRRLVPLEEDEAKLLSRDRIVDIEDAVGLIVRVVVIT